MAEWIKSDEGLPVICASITYYYYTPLYDPILSTLTYLYLLLSYHSLPSGLVVNGNGHWKAQLTPVPN